VGNDNCDSSVNKDQAENRLCVRHGSHWSGSLQNRLGEEQTCGTTLASAYVLHCLSAAWSQLQMIGIVATTRHKVQ